MTSLDESVAVVIGASRGIGKGVATELALSGARRNGDPENRLPGTLNVGFSGAPGQFVAAALDLEGISVSTGAACTSGSLAPSEVLFSIRTCLHDTG